MERGPSSSNDLAIGAAASEAAAAFIRRKSDAWKRARDKLFAESPRADIRTKDIGRRGDQLWVRDAWTFRVQSNLPEKVLVIERLRNVGSGGERAYAGGARPGDIEYRFGYYIVGRIGRAAGRWTWGQFAALIPREDLAPLLEQARAEGTLLPD
jgi:hypothetical protein